MLATAQSLTKEFTEYIKTHNSPKEVMSFLEKKSLIVKPVLEYQGNPLDLMNMQEKKDLIAFRKYFMSTSYNEITSVMRFSMYGEDDCWILLLGDPSFYEVQFRRSSKQRIDYRNASETDKEKIKEIWNIISKRRHGHQQKIFFKFINDEYPYWQPLVIPEKLEDNELVYYKRQFILQTHKGLNEDCYVLVYTDIGYDIYDLAGISINDHKYKNIKIQSDIFADLKKNYTFENDKWIQITEFD